MYNLDDLIQDIHTNEMPEINGFLSKEQRKRIESQALSKIYGMNSRKIFVRKKSLLILTAIFVLTLGITVFAATGSEWDIVLTNFMGLNDPSTLQLKSGEVQIHATASSNGLEITNITSIGDKNTTYIRIDTNYELPKDFNPDKDYILPEHYSTSITDNGQGVTKDHASHITAFYENDKLGFLIEISNCERLNKSNVELKFKNLILYHDLHVYDDSAPEEELLLTGNWDLDWKYSYKSSTRTYRMLKKRQILENTVWITKVEVSPISIRIEGNRLPTDYAKAWGGSATVQEIVFEDGTKIINPTCSNGRSNLTFEIYMNIRDFDDTIDPQGLDYIIVGNEKIEF